MCGIAGILSLRPVDRESIHQMTDTLKHRGPDANSYYISETGTVALGHTRLSIIDLSTIADQPMHSYDGRYVIVFNGEIYNYRELRAELEASDAEYVFKTNSDTEVILCGYHRWGADVCRRLEGMFAFAIFDRKKNSMFLGRDRMGKKPLYYYQDNNHFIFASEIKALLRLHNIKTNVQVDDRALSVFLHLGYIPEPWSAYKQIKKFPAASYAMIDAPAAIEPNKFWRIDDHITGPGTTAPAEAKSKLRALLFNAVEKRLISDVPVGAFLSGGTDSSIITAIASRLKKDRLKTFTIGFEENKFDESMFARRVAQHLKTDHHEYILKETEAIGLLEQYTRHFDEPFADTSAIPTMLVSGLARKEVTVALTGDGGDELFLGYGAYDWADRLDRHLLKFFKPILAQMLFTFGNDRARRASFMFRSVSREQLRSHIFSQEQYLFSIRELNDKLLRHRFPSIFSYHDIDNRKFDQATLQSLFDLQYYLKDDLLVKVDRASMFHALECRSPFLDHHVVEFAMSLSSNLKKKNEERKWVVKEVLREFLPEELIYRPKQGFSVPLAKWMKTDLRYLVEKYLAKETIEDHGFVNYDHVLNLTTSFFAGQDFLYNRLWVLIVLHKWLDENT